MPQAPINAVLAKIKQQDPEQTVFHQAVAEVLLSLEHFLKINPRYAEQNLLERLVEPERAVSFRVPWVTDKGEIRINRGFRVQMNSAIGPYKGGLRFHPSVNLGILKFLAFEQVFKNALTTLPMGGGKGGADFDPKGKSDNEVMRFCQSFMTELSRHIGAFTDIPAGDIGVGGREIGFLFGQYKKVKNEFAAVLTGKELSFGGSLIRPEATGYGLIYFVEEMLAAANKTLAGKKVVVSGSGNVAQYTAEKLLAADALVLALSDSDGYIHFPKGMNRQQLDDLMILKNSRRERLAVFAREHTEDGITYVAGATPWKIPCDIALPCATQNELDLAAAKNLVKQGCFCIAEGANMPVTLDAVEFLLKEEILYAPGKASNAGGVATSGLEISQNMIRMSWERDKVDERLRHIMRQIHESCLEFGQISGSYINYVRGANVGGFKKVADAMLAQGVV